MRFELLEGPYTLGENKAAFRWRGTGTLTGPLDPPGFAPTGKRLGVRRGRLPRVPRRAPLAPADHLRRQRRIPAARPGAAPGQSDRADGGRACSVSDAASRGRRSAARWPASPRTLRPQAAGVDARSTGSAACSARASSSRRIARSPGSRPRSTSASIASCARSAAASARRPEGSQLDEMAAAVLGVAPARDVAELLELVEHEHDVVGVHAERLGELLLGAAVVVAHEAERHQQAQVHAEQLLVAAPVDLLCQAREQDHRAGCGLWALLRHDFAHSITNGRLSILFTIILVAGMISARVVLLADRKELRDDHDHHPPPAPIGPAGPAPTPPASAGAGSRWPCCASAS